jgi:MFS family permease
MVICTGFTRSRKVKLAISWYFFCEGAAIGNWAALLPTVKDEQNITNGELGLVLISAVGGAIFSVPIVSYLCNRYGSGVGLFIGGIILMPLFPLVGVRHNLAVFVLGVFALGFALGWADICMNNQAVVCEKMIRTPTLGLFHAVYAMGGLSGALIGGVLLEKDISVFEEVVIFCLLMIVPQIFFSCWLFTHQEEKLINQTALLNERTRSSDLHSVYSDNKTLSKSGGSQNIAPELVSILDASDGASVASSQRDWQEYSEPSAADYSGLYLLCALCFLGYLGEGSVSDWSTIYFDDTLHTSPLTSTFGYVGFAFAVALARLCSDRIVLSIGRANLLKFAGLVAALGLALSAGAAFVHEEFGRAAGMSMGIAGFACAGAGIGVVAPSVISLAGDLQGIDSSDAIGLVSSLGYVGVMVGPPLFGGIAALAHGLEWSFIADAALMLSVCILACYIRPSPSRASRASSNVMKQPLLQHEESVIQ